MKVEIIDSKDPKRMTIKELANERFIGKCCSSGAKGFVTGIGSMFFFAYTDALLGGRCDSKEECLRTGIEPKPFPEYHVFDTAKELFAWMAE